MIWFYIWLPLFLLAWFGLFSVTYNEIRYHNPFVDSGVPSLFAKPLINNREQTTFDDMARTKEYKAKLVEEKNQSIKERKERLRKQKEDQIGMLK